MDESETVAAEAATVSDAMGAGGWLRLGRLQWGCADVGTAQWHHLLWSPWAQNGWFSYRK